ncbi:choice-of-anchor Q domain-containing protein [Flammeovirgaceae bacterium SG7u.111]|nr:choice-of-anchor Q domain-containing protein [Flammeovirgaceae bacterium SG7u.132]WPO35771.1 choice-of-anchor Q domain-containing protein [Flammeovirgaceae bacterium SG7u.111]
MNKNFRLLPSFFLISLVGVFTAAGIFSSCQPVEEIVTTDPSAKLEFSEDTIFFDTVFTSLGSVTKRLQVLNPSENAVNISSIRLGNTANSAYSLVINGIEMPEVRDMKLLGGDSLLVLVEVEIDPQDEDLPFVVNDSVIFEVNSNVQDVNLVSWGQDAVFFRGGLQAVECDAIWTSNRPYVIYDSLVILEDCELTMEPGTKVYLADNASLFVGGTINILGSAEEPVQIQSVRLDGEYATQYGQWNGIYFLRNSRDNFIDWAEIRNGTIGLYLGTPDADDTPDLVLQNTKIENMALHGIQCITSDLLMTNSLINNCVVNTLRCTAGGNYSLFHNTFASVSTNFFRDEPSFAMATFQDLGNGTVLSEDLQLTMANNIVWGRLEEELILASDEQSSLVVGASQNIFKTIIEDLENGNILNEDPIFNNPFEQDFSLDTIGESPAIDVGLELGVETDLAGNQRDSLPDIGAYEFVKEE